MKVVGGVVPVKRKHHVGNRFIILLVIMVVVMISSSVVVTWAITNSVQQDSYSDEEYILAGNVLELMNRSIDPCYDFHLYACGGWISQQWKDSTSRRDEQLNRVNEEIVALMLNDTTSLKLSENNLRNAYKTCLQETSDDVTLNKWLQSVDDQTSISDVLTFARTIATNVFVKLWHSDDSVEMTAFNRFMSRNPELYKTHITLLLSLQNRTDRAQVVEEVITFEKNINLARYRMNTDSASVGELEGITSQTKMNLTHAILVSSKYLDAGTNISFNRAYLEDLDKNISAKGVRALEFVKEYTKVAIQLQYAKDSSTSYRASHVRTFPYFNMPRTQECLQNVQTFLGFSIGALYINNKSKQSKNSASGLTLLTKEMAKNIKNTFGSRIDQMDWLEERTIKEAKNKLENIVDLIGSPPWINNDTHLLTINYGGTLTSDDFVINYKELFRDMIEKQLGPPQSDLWEVTLGPQVVLNALYYQNLNTINVPSGAMMKPWMENHWPRSMRYGAIGSIIAHEYTHGFDSKGALYDATGKERDWWEPGDLSDFKQREVCFREQYNKYSLHGTNVDGASTLNENIADNGGLELSFESYKKGLDGVDYSLPGINSDELFFLAYAQMWCDVTNNKWSDYFDIHSPMQYRILGVLQNSESFSKVYKCRAGSKMNPSKKCKIW